MLKRQERRKSTMAKKFERNVNGQDNSIDEQTCEETSNADDINEEANLLMIFVIDMKRVNYQSARAFKEIENEK